MCRRGTCPVADTCRRQRLARAGPMRPSRPHRLKQDAAHGLSLLLEGHSAAALGHGCRLRSALPGLCRACARQSQPAPAARRPQRCQGEQARARVPGRQGAPALAARSGGGPRWRGLSCRPSGDSPRARRGSAARRANIAWCADKKVLASDANWVAQDRHSNPAAMAASATAAHGAAPTAEDAFEAAMRANSAAPPMSLEDARALVAGSAASPELVAALSLEKMGIHTAGPVYVNLSFEQLNAHCIVNDEVAWTGDGVAVVDTGESALHSRLPAPPRQRMPRPPQAGLSRRAVLAPGAPGASESSNRSRTLRPVARSGSRCSRARPVGGASPLHRQFDIRIEQLPPLQSPDARSLRRQVHGSQSPRQVLRRARALGVAHRLGKHQPADNGACVRRVARQGAGPPV